MLQLTADDKACAAITGADLDTSDACDAVTKSETCEAKAADDMWTQCSVTDADSSGDVQDECTAVPKASSCAPKNPYDQVGGLGKSAHYLYKKN